MSPVSKATQEFVPIQEVRDGIIILKDGSMRSILIASSINFALKSEDEQNATIFQFQNFLNSLDFQIQIFLQSRRLDIRPYLALLEERQKMQTSDLMRIQIREYANFIKTFTDSVEIMTKSFFVIIPYTPSAIDFSGKRGMFAPKSTKTSAEQKSDSFEESRIQLEQRVSIVSGGLSRCGIRTVPLGTEEIVEVFYKLFNPGDVDKPIAVNQQ